MSARTPLALLPGLLLDEAFWRHQVAGLADIADCWVADFRTQDSMAAMAESVLAAMPPRFCLAGLSMGGYVAFEIMRRAPERVERLALLDTQARPDEDAARARRLALVELARKGKFKGVTPRLLPLFVHPDRLEDEELTAGIMAGAESIGRQGFLNQQKAILGRPDSRPTLATIHCETLVLCGREDQLTPVDRHTEIAAGIARSRLVILEHCGHLPPVELPEPTTSELRRWLSRD